MILLEWTNEWEWYENSDGKENALGYCYLCPGVNSQLWLCTEINFRETPFLLDSGTRSDGPSGFDLGPFPVIYEGFYELEEEKTEWIIYIYFMANRKTLSFGFVSNMLLMTRVGRHRRIETSIEFTDRYSSSCWTGNNEWCRQYVNHYWVVTLFLAS